MRAHALTAIEAISRARSWTLAYAHALYGESVYACVVAAINPALERALVSAIADGVVQMSNSRGRTAARRRLRTELDAKDETAAATTLAQIFLNRGSFHAWLSSAPVLDLIGVAAPAARAPRQLARARRNVTPLEAITLMAFGESWSRSRVLAATAFVAHLVGMLRDDQIGRAKLPDHARLRARGMLAHARRLERRFETARRLLDRDVSNLKVVAFARGAGRALIEADFAASIILDPMSAGFVPERDLAEHPEELAYARRACAELGEIRLSAEALYASKVVAPRGTKVTPASERRAEENLRAHCEAWLRDEAAMPKKAIWIKAEGARIAGSQRAAERAWAAVTTSDPRYAPLRHQGRRKNEAP